MWSEFTTRQTLSKHLKMACKVKNADYWKNVADVTRRKNNIGTRKLNLERKVKFNETIKYC